LYLATASDFVTVNPIEVQTNLAISRTAERIDASHKNSDTKVFLAGSNEISVQADMRFELGAGSNPRDRITRHNDLLTAFSAGTEVYIEHRAAPTKGATLATADRLDRFAGVVTQYNETFPDEEVCNVSLQIAVNSEPAL
jgi:hypothetical protein